MREYRPVLMRARGRSGQMVMPALFALPTLVLFLWLIYETAVISREKIRHQFALDSAAFIEMTNYTDFLNRTAYVNGAFPHRIFREAFQPNLGSCGDFRVARKDDTGDACIYDLLLQSGAFPRFDPADISSSQADQLDEWKISFDGAATPSKAMDKCSQGANGWTRCTGMRPGTGVSCSKDIQSMSYSDSAELPGLLLFQECQAKHTWLSHKLASAVYKTYAQVYMLLGQVEEAQMQVFERLTASHNFLRKSYWLNSGDCDDAAACAQNAASGFKGLQTKIHRIKELNFYANFPTSTMPYYDTGRGKNAVSFDGDGLFQLATVNQQDLDALEGGFVIEESWVAPGNHFGVNWASVMGGNPRVTCTIQGTGGRVWPDPTPKYQTRLYP